MHATPIGVVDDVVDVEIAVAEHGKRRGDAPFDPLEPIHQRFERRDPDTADARSPIVELGMDGVHVGEALAQLCEHRAFDRLIAARSAPYVVERGAQARNRAIVQHHTGGVAALLKSNGAELISGTAELIGPKSVRVAQNGSNTTLTAADAIVVATGATPRTIRGFEPDGEAFASLVDATRGQAGGKLQKYTITAKQIILYFDGLAPGQTVEFTYKLRAKYPLRAKTFESRVYEYYNPAIEDKVQPAELVVKAK